MGRVLADGAAYRGGGSSAHFHMSFLSLSFVCVFYVELCTTYPVVRSVVQRRNITMVLTPQAVVAEASTQYIAVILTSRVTGGVGMTTARANEADSTLFLG